MGRPITKRVERPDDLTDRPDQWPAWVLAFHPIGQGFGERWAEWMTWRQRRDAWVVESTSLWREFRGHPHIGEFTREAQREIRRRQSTTG